MKRFLILAICLAIVAVACGLPQTVGTAEAVPTPTAIDFSLLETSVAQAAEEAVEDALKTSKAGKAVAPTQTSTPEQPTMTSTPSATVAPPTATAQLTPQVVVSVGDSGACPVNDQVTLVWPGYDSPNDLNRWGVGYGEYKKVCFPNGGAVLASYIKVDGKVYDDVANCDRDNNPTEICGYVLHVPPGKVVEFHTGVSGTLFPDPNGEMCEADGVTLHPWLRDITAEVFPPKP